MSVRSILKRKGAAAFSIPPDETLSECISRLLRHDVGALLVVDREGRLCGLISERDILKVCGNRPFNALHILVRDLMTPRQKMITASPDDSLECIMERMTTYGVRHLPIMENGDTVGIVSTGDLMREILHTPDGSIEHVKRLTTSNKETFITSNPITP